MTRHSFFKPPIACVAILAACCVQISCDQKPEHKPIGVVLTYQFLPEDLPKDREIDIQTLVDALNLRITDYGVGHVVGRDRFEVGLYGEPKAEAMEKIKHRIGVRSTLEFRILADVSRTKHHEIIELTKNLPANQKDVKKGDEKVAEWVAYSLVEFGPPEQEMYGMVKRSADGVPEALVLVDVWNVSGNYLTSVRRGLDESGRPAIHFSLDYHGAQRLRKLTSQNLPNSATPDVYRHLGIILNKRLLSAPTVRSTISDQGMISGGSMTEKEVEQTVETLNMSRLPIPFELVDEKRVGNKAASP